MSEAPPEVKRLVLEFPLEAGASWMEQARTVSAPFVERVGEIERPDRYVLICELQPAHEEALIAALQQAWSERSPDVDAE